MIAFLKGIIFDINEKNIILLCNNNVGYKVNLPVKTISKIEKNQDLEIYIHSHIKEDIFDLYGFTNKEELNLFKKLISVNGIGPKAGLEIINKGENDVKLAIINSDEKFLTSISGIGKKTAQRIILELKGKIELDSLDQRAHKSIENDISEDIIDGLINLGFTRKDISKTLEKLPKNIKEEKDIIGFFLKHN